MKERHWNSLTAAMRHGQCVLVLGPEVPVALASPEDPAAEPTSLAEKLARVLASELEDDQRRPAGHTLAALAQQYEDSDGFGAGALRAEAERLFRSSDFAPSTAHQMLASLPFQVILTTGQDNLLATALRACGKTPLVQRYHLRGDKRENPEFVVSGTPDTPLVYHLFGAASDPASLVLSENDLLDFLIGVVSEDPPLPNSLLRALKRPGQSYLFVGFGIRHWQMRLLLKALLRALDLHRIDGSVAAEPLLGLAQLDREETVLFYQRGTRVEVEDSDVTRFLQGLLQRFKDQGGYSGPTTQATRGHRVFISYAREDQALAARVFQALQAANFDPWMDRDALVGGEDWNLHIESELQSTDFTLVLYTPTFCRKTDSYVNKELALARQRALNVRGSFLIPLRTDDIADEDRVRELAEYNEMPLRNDSFDADMAKVVSTMTREFQRRNR